jgi:(Z)-2-((N-methylformamido)methylene)-5-hydroxybutyrolactone dehydrogenase
MKAQFARYEMPIGGTWRAATGGRTYESIDPFSGDSWALIPRATPADVDEAATAADRVFRSDAWRLLRASDRGRIMQRVASAILDRAEQLAAIEVRDNGKLITEMRAQVTYAARWWEYFGGLADKIEGSVLPIDKPDYTVLTRREPLGVIAIITPWNSPLLLATWKMAPAIAAGNTILWKPSEYTSASALEFVKIAEGAGMPPGVINVVTGFGSEIGAAITEHPKVAKIAFTGGDQTGIRVYQSAARGLKPVLLELGGKSANIVFDDAPIEDAVNGAIAGIFAASGQTCIAGSRLLVSRRIHDQLLERLLERGGKAKLGNPALEDTQVGPITTPRQRDKVLSYIELGRSEGAQLCLGGAPADVEGSRSGLFVQPTVFAGVDNRMRIAQDEIFGPVLCVIPFDDDEEAVQLANDSRYGLAAGLWTTDMRRAFRMSEALETGTVWVNTYRAVSFMAPFGGMKHSGFGRENGQHAIEEFLQTKSVWFFTGDKAPDPFSIR